MAKFPNYMVVKSEVKDGKIFMDVRFKWWAKYYLIASYFIKHWFAK